MTPGRPTSPDDGSGNLVLIGLRACGKTTLGREVARRAGRPFVDLDEALAARAGRGADAVLAEDGEDAFRAHEQAVLLAAADLRDHVVATGGGAVLGGEAFEALARPAFVVYLHASVETLVARSAARPRPPLTGLPPAAEVAALLARRDPLYRAAADSTISVEGPDPILAVLARWPPRPADDSTR